MTFLDQATSGLNLNIAAAVRNWNPLVLVYITPQTTAIPNGTIPFGLLGQAKMQPATGGTGGWQIVDRPRQEAATQWYDRPPWSLTLPLRLDSEIIFGSPGHSIEAQCLAIEKWSDAIPQTLQAPVLQIKGPIPGSARNWVVYSMEWGDAYRDGFSANRTMQEITFTMYEYLPPQSSLDTSNPKYSPAAAANNALRQQAYSNAIQGSSYTTYTVKAGETLGSIAANQMGNYNNWTILANLNGIRDPDSLTPGQTIKIPQVSIS